MQLKLKPKQVLPVAASITHTQVKYIPESLTQQQSSLVTFNVSISFLELSPKTVAQAFYQGELEKELRDLQMENYQFFSDSDANTCMDTIEEIRADSVYLRPSGDCTDDCKKYSYESQHCC